MPDNRLSEFSMIPQAINDELIVLGEQLSASVWRIGDLINQAYEIVLANDQSGITKIQVCSWASRRVGKSIRSLKEYAYVAAFYPPEIRAEYDSLPFAHFKFAMGFQLADNGIPGWKKILDRSIEYMGERGFPPSVDALERAFQTKFDAQNEQMHHGELLPGPVSAEISPPPETEAEAGDDQEISWTPIIEGSTNTNPDGNDNVGPGNGKEDESANAQAVEQLSTQLKDICGRISSLIPPMLNLLDIMGNFPELEWAKYFRVETAKIGIRVRQINETVDKMRGQVDGVFLPDDDTERIVDYSEPHSPTPGELPESEMSRQPHGNTVKFH